MIKNFKQFVSQPEQKHRRDLYIKGYHGSTAVLIVLRRIALIMKSERITEPEDSTIQKLTLLLGVLEPLVINEENAEKAILEGIITALGKILLL